MVGALNFPFKCYIEVYGGNQFKLENTHKLFIPYISRLLQKP